jgi:hypothetical protein
MNDLFKRNYKDMKCKAHGRFDKLTKSLRTSRQIGSTAKTRRVSQEMKRQRLYVGSFAAK